MPRLAAKVSSIFCSDASIVPSAIATRTIQANSDIGSSTAAAASASAGGGDCIFISSSSALPADELMGVIADKTQPRVPSFRTVPQNSHESASAAISGAPQLGQWAEAMLMPRSVFVAGERERTKRVRNKPYSPVLCGGAPAATSCRVPAQRISTRARSKSPAAASPRITPRVVTEPTAQSP